jgi:ATP-dependent Clp protease ATP-binding subunit ClpC
MMDARFDRFTERGRQALLMAQEEARRLRHTFVGTEHVLLGILRMPEGVAIQVLEALGVAPGELRAALEAQTAAPGDRELLGEVGLTQRVKKSLDLAVVEAQRMGHHYIGTEHLLLGMIAEREGIAAGVLAAMGVTLDQARLRTLDALGQRKAATGQPQPAGPKNNVVTCRLDDRALSALDALVEAGIRPTRSDAAAWLIGAGIESHRALFDRVDATVNEIRKLRLAAQAMARQAASSTAETPTAPDPHMPPAAPDSDAGSDPPPEATV